MAVMKQIIDGTRSAAVESDELGQLGQQRGSRQLQGECVITHLAE